MTLRRGLRARRANVPARADLRAFAAALRGAERASACRAVVDGPFVTARLRRRVRPMLAAAAPGAASARDPDRAVAVASAVDAGLGILPMAPTCLRRSVTLLRELRRLGLEARLHLGVRTGTAGVEAHAWVQVGDVVVNDDVAVVATHRELTTDAGDVLARLR